MINSQLSPTRGVLPVLFFGVMMGALDISIVGPALPAIKAWFDSATSMQGWIFSIYVLSNLTGIGVFARLSDIWGRKNIYVLAVMVFLVGSVVVATAPTFSILLLGRAIQGLGASGIFPVATAIVGDLFPLQKRGRILGLIGMVFGLAFLIGPLLAGLILKYTSWEMLFWINVPMGVLVALGAWRVLPGKKQELTRKFDVVGMISMSLFLVAFALFIQFLNPAAILISFQNPMVWGWLVFSLFSLMVFLFSQVGKKDALMDLTLFRNRQLLVVFFLASFTGLIQSIFVFIPNFVIHRFEVSFSQASFMLLPIVTTSAAGAPLFGWLLDRVGARIVIFSGLVCLGSGFLWIGGAPSLPFHFYLGGIFIGLGLSVLAGSSLRYVLLNETNVQNRGISQGMLTIFSSLGQIVGGVFIGGWLSEFSSDAGYVVVFLIISAGVVPALLLTLMLKTRPLN